MKLKIFICMIFLLLASANAQDECENCPPEGTPSPLISAEVRENDMGVVVSVALEGQSGNMITRAPLAGATVFAFKYDKDGKYQGVCKMASDEDGLLMYSYKDGSICEKNGCTVKFVFCCSKPCDEGACLVEECFKAMGVSSSDPNAHVSAEGIANCPLVAGSNGGQQCGEANIEGEPVVLLPAVGAPVEILPPPMGGGAFSGAFLACFPVLAVFGLLSAAMFAAGRNPLGMFSIANPRFSKGRIRAVRAKGYTLAPMSMVQGIMAMVGDAAGISEAAGAKVPKELKQIAMPGSGSEPVKLDRGAGGGTLSVTSKSFSDGLVALVRGKTGTAKNLFKESVFPSELKSIGKVGAGAAFPGAMTMSAGGFFSKFGSTILACSAIPLLLRQPISKAIAKEEHRYQKEAALAKYTEMEKGSWGTTIVLKDDKNREKVVELKTVVDPAKFKEGEYAEIKSGGKVFKGTVVGANVTFSVPKGEETRNGVKYRLTDKYSFGSMEAAAEFAGSVNNVITLANEALGDARRENLKAFSEKSTEKRAKEGWKGFGASDVDGIDSKGVDLKAKFKSEEDLLKYVQEKTGKGDQASMKDAGEAIVVFVDSKEKPGEKQAALAKVLGSEQGQKYFEKAGDSIIVKEAAGKKSVDFEAFIIAGRLNDALNIYEASPLRAGKDPDAMPAIISLKDANNNVMVAEAYSGEGLLGKAREDYEKKTKGELSSETYNALYSWTAESSLYLSDESGRVLDENRANIMRGAGETGISRAWEYAHDAEALEKHEKEELGKIAAEATEGLRPETAKGAEEIAKSMQKPPLLPEGAGLILRVDSDLSNAEAGLRESKLGEYNQQLIREYEFSQLAEETKEAREKGLGKEDRPPAGMEELIASREKEIEKRVDAEASYIPTSVDEVLARKELQEKIISDEGDKDFRELKGKGKYGEEYRHDSLNELKEERADKYEDYLKVKEYEMLSKARAEGDAARVAELYSSPEYMISKSIEDGRKAEAERAAVSLDLDNKEKERLSFDRDLTLKPPSVPTLVPSPYEEGYTIGEKGKAEVPTIPAYKPDEPVVGNSIESAARNIMEGEKYGIPKDNLDDTIDRFKKMDEEERKKNEEMGRINNYLPKGISTSREIGK